jgi:hypothetical protein
MAFFSGPSPMVRFCTGAMEYFVRSPVSFTGIHFTLFIWTFYLLWNGKRTQADIFFLLYISVLFLLGNIGNGTNIKFGEMTFIDDRNYPGGPNAFFVEQSINPIAVICNTTYIVNSWLQDGLLVRCLVNLDS